MVRTPIQAVVLAAGRSTRFKTEIPKLLFTVCGQEMILYPLKRLAKLRIPITLVLGYKKELIRRLVEHHEFDQISYTEQAQQRGTGDAVATTMHTWAADHILIMNGDMPLVQDALLQELIDTHIARNATASFVMAHNNDPASAHGYGRIVVRDGMTRIIEARDFTGDPHEDCFVNAGLYIFRRDFLKEYILTLKTHDNSHEIYLPDLIGIAGLHKLPVVSVIAPFDMVRGVNTLQELWATEQIQRAEIIEYWMAQGVRFTYAQSTHVDMDITIGAGSSIGAGAQLMKGTRIGKQVYIGPFCCVYNSVVGDHVTMQSHTVVSDTTICERATVGPFAHIRNNSVVGARSAIGNFVEMTKSSTAHETKIKHFSYINATIGSQVNIGAGTVCCNYDGKSKHETIIHDRAFIGANSSLVAPVTIGADAKVAAGSVIVDDVPPSALAIARARQINKEGYVHKLNSVAPAIATLKPRESLMHE